ncbi:recombinase family protein [Bacillus megaterium]|nr:recombinase family protein [Priestia megaterium]
MKYGYIRVSSDDQSDIRQMKSLLEAGVPEHNIFCDKMSGKNFNRTQYKRLKKIVKPGDTIVFHELDRFGRNFKEGKEEVDYFQRNNIKLIFWIWNFKWYGRTQRCICTIYGICTGTNSPNHCRKRT